MTGLWKSRAYKMAVTLVLSFLLIFGQYSFVGGSISQPADTEASAKHETIFANLGHSGEVLKIIAVNSFINHGMYVVDYGYYETLVNLTNEALPNVEGARIVFARSASEEIFRYQGTLKGKRLPWDFGIYYFLDGKNVEPENIAGKSGRLRIAVEAAPSPDAHPYFTENFMVQIRIPLKMDQTALIQAPDATVLYAGNIATVAFSLMPGSTDEFYLEADVRDFSMDGIDITAMKAIIPANAAVGEIESGFTEMAKGMGELIDGTDKLRQGMVQLSKGVSELDGGADKIGGGTRALAAGIEEYAQGLSQLSDGLRELGTGADEFSAALTALSSFAPQLADGYSGVEEGLNALLANSSQLNQLALALAENPDPQVRMLSQAMLSQMTGLGEISRGLRQTNEGLLAHRGALSEIAARFSEFNKGMQAGLNGANNLEEGFMEIKTATISLTGGVESLRLGIGSLEDNIKILPDEVQKLINGQKKLREGVLLAKDRLGEVASLGERNEPVSFVSPAQANAETVQFVLRTPPIEEDAAHAEEIRRTAVRNIWDRFLDLFRQITGRIFS